MTDEEKKELFIQETVKALVLSEFQEKLLRKILDVGERPIYYIPQRSPIQKILEDIQGDSLNKRTFWKMLAEKTKGVMK